jgi:hypothetical protein
MVAGLAVAILQKLCKSVMITYPVEGPFHYAEAAAGLLSGGMRHVKVDQEHVLCAL